MLPIIPGSHKFSTNQLIVFYSTSLSYFTFVTRELIIQTLPTRDRELELTRKGNLTTLKINRVLYMSSMFFSSKLLGDKDTSNILFDNALRLALDPSLYMIQSEDINLSSAWLN